MPPLNIRNFAAGLVADLHPATLPEGATPDCHDLVFDRRTAKVRPGRTLHTKVYPGLALGPRALGQHVPLDDGKVVLGTLTRLITGVVTVTLPGAATHGFSVGELVEIAGTTVGAAAGTSFNGSYEITGVPAANQFTYSQPSLLVVDNATGGTAARFARLVAVIDNDLYCTSTGAQEFVGNANELMSTKADAAVVLTVDTTKRVRFAQLGSAVYAVDGTNYAKKLLYDLSDPTLVAEVRDDLLAPTFTPGVAAVNVAAVGGACFTGYLDPGTYEFAFSYADTIDSYLSSLGPVGQVTIAEDEWKSHVDVALLEAMETEASGLGANRINLYSRNPYTDGQWVRVWYATLPSTYIPGTLSLYVDPEYTAVGCLGATRTNGVAQFTTDVAHGLTVGQHVVLADIPVGAAGTSFNGTHVVQTVVGTDAFTCLQGLADDSAGPGGTATPNTEVIHVDLAVRDAAGIVTVTTRTAHGFQVGQHVTLANMPDGAVPPPPDFSDTYGIATVPAPNQFTADSGIAAIADTSDPYGLAINAWARAGAGTVTITTVAAAHGFAIGDEVLISGGLVGGVAGTYPNGRYTITALPAANQFRYVQSWLPVVDNAAAGGTASVVATATWDPRSLARISNMAWAADVITFTTRGYHQFAVGEWVRTAGNNPAGYNGRWQIASVPSQTQFTVAEAVNPGAAVSTGTAYLEPNRVAVNASGYAVRDVTMDFIPVGCATLCEHNSRMLYAKGSTLYVSNLLDPTQVPISTFKKPADSDGYVAAVGTDGDAITGVCSGPGSDATIFKKRSVWRLTGDTPSTFRPEPVSREHGCVAQETICSTPYGVFWLSYDHVCLYDGSSIQTLSADRVASLIAGYSDAQKEGAFAVYDPANLRYMVTFPSAAGVPEDEVPWPTEYRRPSRNARAAYRSEITGSTGQINLGAYKRGLALDKDLNAYVHVWGTDPASWVAVQKYNSLMNLMWQSAIYDYNGSGIAWAAWTRMRSSPTVDYRMTQLYVADTAYSIVALSLTDGSEVWRYTPNAPNEQCHFCPALGRDGYLYFATYRAAGGNSYAYKISADGVLVWKTDLLSSAYGSDYISGPVSTDSAHVYVPSTTGLSKLAMDDGEIIWQVALANNPYGPNVSDPDYIYLQDSSGRVRKLSKVDGSVLWSSAAGLSQSHNVPLLSPRRDRVYICGQGGAAQHVYCFDAETGGTVWTYKDGANPNERYFSPILDWEGNLVMLTGVATGVSMAVVRLTPAGAFLSRNAAANTWEYETTVALAQESLFYCGGSWIRNLTCQETWEPKSDTLLFDLREKWWSKWTKQPGGGMLYSDQFAVTGIYAVDPYGPDETGRVWRLNVGTDDDGWPILWEWQSKEVDGEGRYLDPAHVQVGIGAYPDDNTLTAAIRKNEETMDNTSRELTLAPGTATPREVTWSPARLADCGSFRVRLSGESYETAEVRSLGVQVVPRGRMI